LCIITGVNTVKLKQAATFTWQSINQLLWPVVCVNYRESIWETDKDLCKDCWDQLLFCTAGDYCLCCSRDDRQKDVGGVVPIVVDGLRCLDHLCAGAKGLIHVEIAVKTREIAAGYFDPYLMAGQKNVAGHP